MTDYGRLEEIEKEVKDMLCVNVTRPTRRQFRLIQIIDELIARVREAEEKLSHAAQCLDTESDEAEDVIARLRARVEELSSVSRTCCGITHHCVTCEELRARVEELE